MSDENQKLKLIEELQRRIKYLVNTDNISDAEKVVIASKALSIIENGKKEVVK